MATEEEAAPANIIQAEEKVEEVPQEEKVAQVPQEQKVEDEAPAKVEETQPEEKDTRESEAKAEQIPHEKTVGDEAQAKVEEIQPEAKTGDEAQPKVEDIQQDAIIDAGQVEQLHETDVKVEQIPQEEGVVKTEAEVEKPQYDDEEKLQTVMDLDGPSIMEGVSDINAFRRRITFTEEEEEYSDAGISEILKREHPEMGGEGFQTAMFGLEGQFPFTSADGFVPPPSSPAVTEDGSRLEMESEYDFAFDMEDETSELSIGSQTEDGDKKSQKSKAREGKKAGFKIGVAKDAAVSDRDGAGAENRVVIAVRDREKEKQQAECNRYAGFEKFATTFVDKLIDKSLKNVENPLTYSQFGEEELSFSSLRTYVEIFGAYTKWPRIQEFSKVIGEEMINEFLQTWDYDEDWMYCIDFLLEQSDECSEFYFYEAKWSIPSKSYPIPQATASVYFTIEVSRVKPIYCPVDVTYMFEGSRTIHTPGRIAFQEHWLFSIIDAKLKMYQHVKF